MSRQSFNETHHTDKAGKWISWILAVIILAAGAIGLSWNESNKTATNIAKTNAAIDSLSKELEWRGKVISHHDSLQAIAADAKSFRKLPLKTRQSINAELAATSSKITTTKQNKQILEKLLDAKKQNLAKLEAKTLYKIYH